MDSRDNDDNWRFVYKSPDGRESFGKMQPGMVADGWRFQKGWAIDVADEAGITPLRAAAMTGKPEMVKLLLSRGASVNKPGTFGPTPLHATLIHGTWYASDKKSICTIECIRLLLEAKADPKLEFEGKDALAIFESHPVAGRPVFGPQDEGIAAAYNIIVNLLQSGMSRKRGRPSGA